MFSRKYQKYFYLCGFVLVLLVFALLTGCISSDQALTTNSSGVPVNNSPGQVIALPNTTPTVTPVIKDPYNTENQVQLNHDQLEKAWKTFRVINTDTNERYLKLDLYKSDDINYFRYQMVPETVRRIGQLQSDLQQIEPANDLERNDTKAFLEITNYTILKYEGLATVMHATQYVAIGDPIKMKTELRKAKFQISDAIDIINDREISEYPSLYRDQVIADKSYLNDLAATVDSMTRTIYLSPPVWGSQN